MLCKNKFKKYISTHKHIKIFSLYYYGKFRNLLSIALKLTLSSCKNNLTLSSCENNWWNISKVLALGYSLILYNGRIHWKNVCFLKMSKEIVRSHHIDVGRRLNWKIYQHMWIDKTLSVLPFLPFFPPSLYPLLYSPSSYPEFSLFYRLILPMALFHHSMLA